MASNADLLKFLDNGPSPYHVVNTSAKLLEQNGFTKLDLSQSWELQKSGKYYVTKGLSTVVAFVVGGEYQYGNGYVVVGAHTDSPCLKVRPVSKLTRDGFKQVTVDTYGGGLWRTWMDRNLSLAGLVTYRRGDKINHSLVNLKKPILYVPSLAIHLETDRKSFSPDYEEHLQPIFCTSSDSSNNDKDKDHHSELLALITKELGGDAEIIDFDLRAYNTEAALIGGVNEEFVFSARLDNLVGTYAALNGLVESAKDASSVGKDRFTRIAVCFDHEEVGSQSAAGAQTDAFSQILKRIVVSGETPKFDAFGRAIANSFIISADQAHAAHPNYPEKHERNHRPRFDGSVVVKVNANQRYATTTTSHTVLAELARRCGVKLTKVVVKNSSPCGSTIGPMLSANTGALTVDVGCSQLAMHSCRECGDLKGVFSAVNLFSEAFKSYGSIHDNLNRDIQ